MDIFFTNSFTNKKELFKPSDPQNVKMYVCGPTVYDRIHIGNARSIFVFDLIFNFLKQFYNVTYVRNITDVDDKIIAGAQKQNEDIKNFTARMIKYFHQDTKKLGCSKPSHEPKATDNIHAIIKMIESLLANGNAYCSNQHVYFDVASFKDYGKLSNKNLDELQPGARIKQVQEKKSPLDFVLWKPAKPAENMSFESPWGAGRPGWHIECSAMSKSLLGNNIDIHGGGSDLLFPHHENEIAQSKCESHENKFAKYWLHNGFLTVGGEKMSKSLDNFTTVRDLIDKGISTAALRYFFLTAHYRKPLDFNEKAISDAQKNVAKFNSYLNFKQPSAGDNNIPKLFLNFLADDLNTPQALAYLHQLITNDTPESKKELAACCKFLGLFTEKQTINADIHKLAQQRFDYKKAKEWAKADIIRAEIEAMGYQILDENDSFKIKKIY
jgi:cysteinyl-tRNA synthetase